MAETPCGQQSCHLLYGSEIAKNKKIVDALANACPLVLVNSSVIPVAQHIIEAFYPSTYLNSPGGFANLPQLWCFTNFAPDTTIQLSVFLSFHWLKMGYLTLKHCSVRIYNDEPHLLLSQVQPGHRSVQSCPTLCSPVDHSTPGLPVHHQLPEFTQTHVHRVADAIQPSHPLSSPSPPTTIHKIDLVG